MEEKKIKFSGDGAELSALMKKLQSDGKNMYESFAKEAVKITSNSKEQNKIIAEQIKLYREALKVQKEITEEKLKQAQGILNGIPERGFENMAERTAAERKIKRITSELNEIRDQDKAAGKANEENRNRRGDERPSIFNDIVKAGLFRDILGLFRQIPNQENGLGLISPALSLAGTAAGAGAGALIDAANISVLGNKLGDIHASTFLAQIGKEGGGFLGDAIERSFKIRDQFSQSYNRYTALGGHEGIVNASGMGFSDIDFATSMGGVSRSRGSTRSAATNALFQLGLSRGFGIDEGTVMGAFGMERSGAGKGLVNMQRALGIAFAEGLDRAKFSDAIINQTQLLQQFAVSKNNVSATDANRTLFEFNRMGGMFSLGDPRSMGNILGVNRGLAQPSSPFLQAQNYQILRGINPNADPFELAKMQEQGLQTPGFLKKVMDQMSNSGFSEPLQKFMLKSRFSELSYEGVDTLFKNKDKIGSMTSAELRATLGTDQVKKEAEEMTSRYTRMNAEVVNAFREDFLRGISVLSKQFEDEMGRAIEEVAKKFMSSKDASGPLQPKYNPPGSKTPLEKGMERVNRPDGSSMDYRPLPAHKPKTYYY